MRHTTLPIPTPAPLAAAMPVHIRWFIRRDMPAVLEIESESFPYPWDEESFLRVMRQRNCVGLVAEYHDTIVGFVIYELFDARMGLLNLAVATRHRRQGVGAQLIAWLRRKLSPERRVRITLEVGERNLAAQLFFRSQGFRAVSILRDFYEDTDDDAYVMQYQLPKAQECRGR